MTAGQAGTAVSEVVALPPRWPIRRVIAWALIGAGIVGFLIAGDVRTNWVVGDTLPERGEVALPRIATVSMLIGLALLAWHQLVSRRSLPETRYRGPSVLVLLALLVGLSILIALPLRNSINRAFEGGIPDLPPMLIFTVAIPLATVTVTWLVLRANPMPGLRWFRDPRLGRHALIGVAVGTTLQIALLGTSAVLLWPSDVSMLQVPAGPLPGPFLPGQPLWLAALSSVVLAPMTEELFFRGLALNAWLREYGRLVGLIGSSVVFGLVHYGLNPLEGLLPELPWLALPTVSGLVLGVLALRTGSLIAPITAHASMNTVTFLLTLALVAG